MMNRAIPATKLIRPYRRNRDGRQTGTFGCLWLRIRRGLTLVEILVATALLAALLAGLWSLVSTFTSLGAKGEERTRQLRSAGDVLHQFEQDLRSVPAVDTESVGLPELVGTPTQLDLWIVGSPDLDWLQELEGIDKDATQLSTSERLADVQDPYAAGRHATTAMRRVQYRLLTDEMKDAARAQARFIRSANPLAIAPASGTAGQRRDWPPSIAQHDAAENPTAAEPPVAGSALRVGDLAPDPPQRDADQYVPKLYPDIEAVRFAYYDGIRWRRSWDSRAEQRLPVAVKFEVWFLGGSSLSPSNADERPFDESRHAASEIAKAAMEPGNETQRTWHAPDDRMFPLPARPADLYRLVVTQPTPRKPS